MFNQGQPKTSLIIVYDNKTEEYATFLQQLISQNDDSDEEIVGVKDGSVDATIWTTKVYEESLPKLTSSTHVVFIGSGKIAKDQGRNINFSFSKYGMNYGWLGKRAVLYVDTKQILKKKEYDEFLTFCENSFKKFEKATLKATDTLPHAVALIGAAFLPVALPVFGLITGGIVSLTALKNQKNIQDQQFRCLTMAFYMDGLKQFLEG